MIDSLTKLNNMAYLKGNYEYDNKYMIVIDFAKLKYINDNFGHEAGDICLANFGKVLKRNFKDSTLIRGSGDEFIIITDKEKLEEKLELCYIDIKAYYKMGFIPFEYGFNCGITPCYSSLDETLERADITMYNAKENGELFNYFDNNIYNNFKSDEAYISKIKNMINNDNISVKYNFVEDDIYSAYLIDKGTNERLYDEYGYKLLEKNFMLKKLDLIMLQEISNTNKNIFVNIHHDTILNRDFNIIDYINKLIKDGSKIIFNVDIENLKDKEEFVYRLKELKELGFKISLNKLNNNTISEIMYILSYIDIDYTLIDRDIIKESMLNDKIKIMLNNYLNILRSFNTRSIFHNLSLYEKEYVDMMNIRDKHMFKEKSIH